MFDKLVVSTAQRRGGRTAKFFAGTSFIYLSIVGCALAASVLFAAPKLADTSLVANHGVVFPIAGPTHERRNTQRTEATSTTDPRKVESLDTIISNLGHTQRSVAQSAQPPGPGIIGGVDAPGDSKVGLPGMPDSIGRDVGSANVHSEPPRPDPPKPQARPADNVKPVLVSSSVLQGKAIDRIVPIYPELPKRIRLQGEVSLEVIISPEGRVESVRVVSGHPMLIGSALAAARGWRFESTFLNGVPVRVTGVITFVFKLNE